MLTVVVLVLIHAARSHFPVIPFALVLLVALLASVYSGARRVERRRMSRRTPLEHAQRRRDAA
jgi:hypothetical protein